MEDPLRCDSDCRSRATNGVREDFRNQHPTNRAPGEHKRGGIEQDGNHRNQLQSFHAKGRGHTESTDGHTYATGDEQRFAPPLLDGEDGHQGKQDVDHTHHHGVEHRVGHAHVTKDARRIVQHGVDTHHLLENAQHDTDEDHQPAVGEQLFGLHLDGALDVGQNDLGLFQTVNFRKDTQSLVVLASHH